LKQIGRPHVVMSGDALRRAGVPFASWLFPTAAHVYP
jgi:hypothetical protein